VQVLKEEGDYESEKESLKGRPGKGLRRGGGFLYKTLLHSNIHLPSANC